MGWSDVGRGDLRADNDDREALRRLLDMAQAEGRLDALAYARRMDAVQAAKKRADLVVLASDLPNRRGVRDWVAEMRVRRDDRERAVRWLAEAAAQGRLTTAEHERRAAEVSTVETYAGLESLLLGVPGWPGTDEKALLAGTADREAALTQLAQAVTDGRVEPAEHPALEADVGQARRVSDLRALMAAVEARASDQERDDTARALEAAYREGRIDVEERAARIERTQTAATNSDLRHLVRDLEGNARLLAQGDRDKLAARLKRALDDGRLDLAEYDARLSALNAAATVAETVPLFTDLIPRARSSRRDPLDAVFDYWIFNSAMLPAPRHWWQYLYPKLTWKVLIVGTLLGWGYAILAVPIWATVLTALGGWIPVVGLAVAYARLARDRVGDIAERQRAAISDIRAELRRKYPDVSVKIVLDNGHATIELGSKKNQDAIAGIRDEVVRLLWNSRLYPLKHIRFEKGLTTTHTVMWNRTEKRRLRHLYGPRPYGPLPKDLSNDPTTWN